MISSWQGEAGHSGRDRRRVTNRLDGWSKLMNRLDLPASFQIYAGTACKGRA